MAETMAKTNIQILKAYFDDPPVTSKELISFKKEDPDGFAEVAALAAAELGVEQKKTT